MRRAGLLVTALAAVLAFGSLGWAAADRHGGGGDSVTATGVVVDPGADAYGYGSHALIDEASGTEYALESESVPLDDHVGERVRVEGVLEAENDPTLIGVEQVEREPGQPRVENSIRGRITDISRSAKVVLVEENPDDRSGSEKGEFAVAEGTAILRQQNGSVVAASFVDLAAGQLVEAVYAGPVAESYPTQGLAGSIIILEENPAGAPDDGSPDVLPDTGGTAPPSVAPVTPRFPM